MKRNVFTMIGVVMVITVSGLGALTSYATSSGGAVNNQETLAKPAVYMANVIQNMGNWENINDTWKFKLKDGSFLTYSWVQSINNESYYYFLSSDGVMLTNTTTPDGYVVDSAGIWTASVERPTTVSQEEIDKNISEGQAAQSETMDQGDLNRIQDYGAWLAESIANDPEHQKDLSEHDNND